MSRITLRPNATGAFDDWSSTGDPAHDCLSDDSDSTWIALDSITIGATGSIALDLENPSLPPDATPTRLIVKLRVAAVDGFPGWLSARAARRRFAAGGRVRDGQRRHQLARRRRRSPRSAFRSPTRRPRWLTPRAACRDDALRPPGRIRGVRRHRLLRAPVRRHHRPHGDDHRRRHPDYPLDPRARLRRRAADRISARS